MKSTRDLIAYNDLKREIIDPGFCTLCGACEAACPVGAIRIEDDRLSRMHDCAEQMRFCPLCYDVCPHTETLLLETAGFLADAPRRREGLGYYREILLSQATDPTLRELSHSGGVVTALLKYAIEEGIIDSAVTSESEVEVPVKLKPLISLVPDDLLSAVDAKFSPSAVAVAFGRAVYEYGKSRIAFVGVPCHVLALRKLEAWGHKLMESLRLVIGLICLWCFSLPHLLGYFSERYGIKPSEIRKISLDVEYAIHVDGRVLRIPISEVESHILPSCRTCMDATSELSDISVGGAYPLEDWSTVIIRTEVGETLFKRAVKAGVLRVKRIEERPEVFEHLVRLVTFKRKAAIEEIKRRQKTGEPIPPITFRLTSLVPKEVSLLSSLTVREVMSRDVVTVSPETTAEELLNFMTQHHHMGYPVVNRRGELVGIVTFEDLSRVPQDQRSRVTVHQIASKRLVTVHPDEPLIDAYEKMSEHEIGRIIVTDPENPKKILGIITRTDIMHALHWPMRER